MTDVCEGVAMLAEVMDKDAKCTYKPDEKTWKANLDGDGKKLGDNLGNKPNASKESELSSKKWPSQAHHLIPHLTLKKHAVACWLKGDDEIWGDTQYNVDHENNGKWMPYASSLSEWVTGATKVEDKNSNRKLMFKVMSLARIQMHQGKHSGSKRYGIGEAPYKERVSQYLEKIDNNAISHYSEPKPCKDCKGDKAGKLPPRQNTVRYVDKASGLIEKDIDCCRIFVSKIAAEFAELGGFKSLGS